MLNKILPEKIAKIIGAKVNMKYVNELRFRADKPIILSVSGKNYFLGENGLTSSLKEALFSSKIVIEDIVFRASECSIYSVNEQIKRGYIVTDSGLRLGIGGNVVEENGQVKVVPDVETALACIPTGQEAFVIGGGQVYRQFLPYCQQAYVTDVKGVFDADVFFPELAVEEWDCVEEGSWQKDEKSGLEYRFMIYRRKENA